MKVSTIVLLSMLSMTLLLGSTHASRLEELEEELLRDILFEELELELEDEKRTYLGNSPELDARVLKQDPVEKDDSLELKEDAVEKDDSLELKEDAVEKDDSLELKEDIVEKDNALELKEDTVEKDNSNSLELNEEAVKKDDSLELKEDAVEKDLDETKLSGNDNDVRELLKLMRELASRNDDKLVK